MSSRVEQNVDNEIVETTAQEQRDAFIIVLNQAVLELVHRTRECFRIREYFRVSAHEVRTC